MNDRSKPRVELRHRHSYYMGILSNVVEIWVYARTDPNSPAMEWKHDSSYTYAKDARAEAKLILKDLLSPTEVVLDETELLDVTNIFPDEYPESFLQAKAKYEAHLEAERRKVDDAPPRPGFLDRVRMVFKKIGGAA